MGLKFHRMLHTVHQATELDNLAVKHGTDKQITGNFYTPHYASYFDRVRNEPIRILELGIGPGAPFLKALGEYFPNAHIFGAEINKDFCDAYQGRGTILRGNLAEEEFLKQIAQHAPFDIIIEDADHSMQSQQRLFNFLFPCVSLGGVYIIEDMGTSYLKSFGGAWGSGTNTTSFLTNLVDYINRDFFRPTSWFNRIIRGPYHQDSTDEPIHPNEEDIYSIHFYRGVAFIFKQRNSYED